MDATSTIQIYQQIDPFWDMMTKVLVPAVTVALTLFTTLFVQYRSKNEQGTKILAAMRIELLENLKIVEDLQSLVENDLIDYYYDFFLKEYNGCANKLSTKFYEMAKDKLILVDLANDDIEKIIQAYNSILGLKSDFDDDYSMDSKYFQSVKEKIRDASLLLPIKKDGNFFGLKLVKKKKA